MNTLKEVYFSHDNFDRETFLLKEEIKSLPIRQRQWKAGIEETGLLVTDLQNYFLSADSHAFIPSAPAILPVIRMLTRYFRNHNRPVIFTRHVNEVTNAASMGWWWNDLIGQGTAASELVPGICQDDDTVLVKHQYDAFHGTRLEELLISNNIRYPVICGVMTNLCCETTLRSAFVRGFRPVLPLDATAAYNRLLHLSAFRNISFGFSPAMTASEVLGNISGS